jgi:hypothetical protein
VNPLLLAAKNGHKEVAKTLLRKGLEENAAESLGCTELLEAEMTRQWGLAQGTRFDISQRSNCFVCKLGYWKSFKARLVQAYGLLSKSIRL